MFADYFELCDVAGETVVVVKSYAVSSEEREHLFLRTMQSFALSVPNLKGQSVYIYFMGR